MCPLGSDQSSIPIHHNLDLKKSNPMKTPLISFCATLLLVAPALLNAADAPKPKTGSPEFERMKTLVGTWKGKTDMGQGPST